MASHYNEAVMIYSRLSQLKI